MLADTVRSACAVICRKVANAGRLVAELAKELADENAYARHLAKGGYGASGEEWRKFCDRRLRAKYSQGKCC